jgi:MutS domain V
MKAHLLFPDGDFDFTAELPADSADLIQDLELGTILAAMAGTDKFLLDVCTKVLLTSVTDPAIIGYRQRILADCIAQPETIRAMYDITVGALADRRSVWGFWSSQNPTSILAGAVNQLEVLIVRLHELRQLADQEAGRFGSEGLSTLLSTLQDQLDDEYFATLSGHLKQLRFRSGEVISAQLDRDNSGINFILRAGAGRRSWKERVGIEPRSVYSFTIPPRDEAGAHALQDMANRGINLVANAAAQSADHVSSYFTMLRAELGFYVCCLSLREQLAARGQPATFPVPEPLTSPRFTCTDLRDASLALRTGFAVGNDVASEGKPLVLITGANSGGKSTFLRSAGQAMLMMQSGMFVVAEDLHAGVCAHMFTHFMRDEDPAMVSGRLDEELKRMSAIADRLTARSVVLFNESFAATNEREGSEIARQVVRALLESDVRVFFVTHLFDFADTVSRAQPDATLCLLAPRESDGRRPFRLAAGLPKATSYGPDLYERLGGWLPGPATGGPEPAEPGRPPVPEPGAAL